MPRAQKASARKRKHCETDVGEKREQPHGQEKKQFKQGDIVLVRLKGCPVWWPGKVIEEDSDTYTAHILSDKSDFIIHQRDTLAFDESVVEKSLEILKKKKMKMTLNSFLEDLKLLKGDDFTKVQPALHEPTLNAHPTEEDQPFKDAGVDITEAQPALHEPTLDAQPNEEDQPFKDAGVDFMLPEPMVDVQPNEEDKLLKDAEENQDDKSDVDFTEVQPELHEPALDAQPSEEDQPFKDADENQDGKSGVDFTEVQPELHELTLDAQPNEEDQPFKDAGVDFTEVQPELHELTLDAQPNEEDQPFKDAGVDFTEVQPELHEPALDAQPNEEDQPFKNAGVDFTELQPALHEPTVDAQPNEEDQPFKDGGVDFTKVQPELHEPALDAQPNEEDQPFKNAGVDFTELQPALHEPTVDAQLNEEDQPFKDVDENQDCKSGLESPKEQSTSPQPQADAHPMEDDKPSEDENEYQNSSGSEYQPDSCEESDSGRSIEEDADAFIMKEHRVECSESDDETRSDVFPMLQEKTKVMVKENNSDTQTKGVVENETDDEDIDEDQILRDKHNQGFYIKKVSKSSTTKTGKCKKFDRVYNSYQYCGICNVMVSNFAQHLDRNRKQHESSKEVNDIRNETDRKRKAYLRTLLRAKLNHKFNMNNIVKGKGEILLERRPTGSFDMNDYGPCPKCFLWIAKRLLLKHQRFCVVNDANEHTSSSMLQTQSDIITKRLLPEASKSLIKEVFMVINNDEVGQLVRNDPLIIQLGNIWMAKNIDNKLKRGSYTSQILRLVGRMLINLRNLKPLNIIEAQLWDYLKPENFDALAEATLLTAAPSNDDEENLLKPSNAIKLGYDIKRLINFKVGMAIMQNDTKSRQDAENLLKTMNIFWGTKVTKLARVLLEQRKYCKRNELPLPQDIQKLTEYLKKTISEFDLTKTDAASFQHVAAIVSARLLTYNRRRTGELQAITLEDYASRKTAGSEITAHVLGDCTEFEKRLLASQELMTVRGKTGRGVPVLIPEDSSAGLTYLTNREVRKVAGLPVNNHYIFANHDSVVRAYDSLAKSCRDADLVAPERITSTNLRKYMATMTQVLDLKEQEMNWVLNHLGHTLDVHQIHYRCTSEALEKTQIAKILLLQDCDMIGRFRNKTLQDIQLTDLISQDDNPAETGPLPQENQIELVLDVAEKLEEEEEDMPKTKQLQGTKKKRQGWSFEEEEEIRSLFNNFLEESKRPKPKEIEKNMNKSKQNNGLIYKRKKDDLKKKVFRMVDKIKRKK